jgi:hypothetical protein
MYDKFRKFSNKWLKFNSTSADGLDSLLMGEIYSNCKTVRVKEYQPKKTPYHAYYKYKLPDQSNTTATTSSSSSSSSSTTNTKRNLLLKSETTKTTTSSDSEASKKSTEANIDEKTT